MIERIGNLAERLATNVSQSRRGFLARAGQAALGVAGVLAGLVALPTEAQAILVVSACEVQPVYGGGLMLSLGPSIAAFKECSSPLIYCRPM